MGGWKEGSLRQVTCGITAFGIDLHKGGWRLLVL